MVQQAQFTLNLGRMVADAPKMPAWKAGDAFGRVRAGANLNLPPSKLKRSRGLALAACPFGTAADAVVGFTEAAVQRRGQAASASPRMHLPATSAWGLALRAFVAACPILRAAAKLVLS